MAKGIAAQMFLYRTNFFLWRGRQVMQVIVIYFLWLAVLPSNTNVGEYTQSVMLTYILTAWIVGMIVYSTRTVSVADDINNGELTNKLLQPTNYFLSWFAIDMGDKFMNVGLSLIEFIILFLILRPPFYFQTNIQILLLATLSVINAVIVYFFFNLLLGFIAFWSPEVWAPRFIFTIVISFFSGGLFPLDLLPKNVYQFFEYLPFTYLLYFPTKVYLGQMDYLSLYKGIVISLIWIILLYMIVQYMWTQGLKSYTAHGR